MKTWGGGGRGGHGSGGALRLVANRVTQSGQLGAVGNGGGSAGQAGDGRIRIEAFEADMSGSSSPPASFAPPISVGLVDQGTIRIASIAGQVVPIPPGGDTASPDVLFTEAGDVTINFQTVNVPQGTELSVRVTARGVVIDATSTPVDALGAASATLTVPAGVGTIQAFADYLLP